MNACDQTRNVTIWAYNVSVYPELKFSTLCNMNQKTVLDGGSNSNRPRLTFDLDFWCLTLTSDFDLQSQESYWVHSMQRCYILLFLLLSFILHN